MEYDQEQLNSLMASVEKEFSAHLAKAEESFNLTKAEDFPKKEEPKAKEEKKPEESKGDSKKPIEEEKPGDKGAKDQNQQEAGASPLPKEGDPSEPKADANPADPAAANPAAAPGQDDHGYDDDDMKQLDQMYGSMSRGELKVHHDRIRSCMDGMGLAKCEDGMAKAETSDAAKDAEGYRPNGGPKDGEAAKTKTPASSDAQALNKSEAAIEIDLIKSELSAEKAKSEDLKKNLEAVESFLKKYIQGGGAPAGKAITSLDIIAKTENGQAEKPLSKSEIHAKLLAKANDRSLSKSDREAINSYYFSKNVETVRHLLK